MEVFSEWPELYRDVCVCERERESVCVYVCVCVCERERGKKSVFGFRKSTIKQMPEFAFEPVAPLLLLLSN